MLYFRFGTEYPLFIFHEKIAWLQFMVRIDNKNYIDYTYFPINGSNFPVTRLKLRSEVTGEEFTFSLGTAYTISNYSAFVVDFSDMQDGEYLYFLTDNDGNYENNGLLRIGKIEETSKEYNAKRIDAQYTPDF